MRTSRAFAGLILAAVLAATGPAVVRAQQQPGGVTATPEGASPLGGPVFANPEPPGPGVPRDDILEVMVRSALITLNDANASGNYAVLGTRMHSEFRQQVPPDSLAGIFAAFRTNRIDLAPLLVHKVAFTEAAAVDANGILSAKGRFETRPWRTSFDLAWRLEGGRWMLWKINVQARPPEP